jgi:hypothetical protein
MKVHEFEMVVTLKLFKNLDIEMFGIWNFVVLKSLKT